MQLGHVQLRVTPILWRRGPGARDPQVMERVDLVEVLAEFFIEVVGGEPRIDLIPVFPGGDARGIAPAGHAIAERLAGVAHGLRVFGALVALQAVHVEVASQQAQLEIDSLPVGRFHQAIDDEAVGLVVVAADGAVDVGLPEQLRPVTNLRLVPGLAERESIQPGRAAPLQPKDDAVKELLVASGGELPLERGPRFRRLRGERVAQRGASGRRLDLHARLRADAAGKDVPRPGTNGQRLGRSEVQGLPLVAAELDAFGCIAFVFVLRHGHNRRAPCPGPPPGALPRLDGRGPILTAGPDPQEIGPVGREPAEDLLRLRQVHVLRGADEGEILPDQKERPAAVELQESRVPFADADESLALARRDFKPHGRRAAAPAGVFPHGDGQIRARFRRREAGAEARRTGRIDPVGRFRSAGDLPALVLLAPEGRQAELGAAGGGQFQTDIHFVRVEGVAVRAAERDDELDLLVLPYLGGGDLHRHGGRGLSGVTSPGKSQGQNTAEYPGAEVSSILHGGRSPFELGAQAFLPVLCEIATDATKTTIVPGRGGRSRQTRTDKNVCPPRIASGRIFDRRRGSEEFFGHLGHLDVVLQRKPEIAHGNALLLFRLRFGLLLGRGLLGAWGGDDGGLRGSGLGFLPAARASRRQQDQEQNQRNVASHRLDYAFNRGLRQRAQPRP